MGGETDGWVALEGEARCVSYEIGEYQTTGRGGGGKQPQQPLPVYPRSTDGLKLSVVVVPGPFTFSAARYGGGEDVFARHVDGVQVCAVRSLSHPLLRERRVTYFSRQYESRERPGLWANGKLAWRGRRFLTVSGALNSAG